MEYHGSRLLVRTVSTILAVAVGGVGTPAFAQTEPEGVGVGVGGLEEIVVTARKRDESVQDVPLLVTAVSADQIRENDLTSLDKLAATMPNFLVGRASNGSGAQVTLRGIGSSSTSIGIEQSVAVIVDGIYYGQGRIIEEGFFDLQSLEILKGPQALFFGKNATAGAINMTTNDPGNETEIEGRANYEFESESVQVEGIFSTPVSDTFGVRVALRGTKMDGGYYKNEMLASVPYPTFDVATDTLNPHTALPESRDQPGMEELLGRITLKWTPNDQFAATLKAAYDKNEVNNSSWNYVCYRSPTGISALSPYGPGDPDNYPCREHFVTHQLNAPVDFAADFPYARGDGSQYNDYESKSVTLNLEYDLDSVDFTWVSNWNRNENQWACNCDFQGSPVTTFATENSPFTAVSSELRALTKSSGSLNGMLGVYYQDTTRDFHQHIGFANVEDSTVSPENRYQATSKRGKTDGETLSVFGQLIWSITETVEATAGARYTDETKDSDFRQPYNNAAVTEIFRPAEDPLGVVVAHQTFTNTSPEVTLSWTPVADVMLYAAYKSGYKSGGFSISGINSAFRADPLSDLTFDPEKARGFEAGVKSTILDQQLRLNMTAYEYKFIDLQVDFFRSDVFAFNTITADAKTRGVELSLEYVPQGLPGLNLHGEFDYNKATYEDSLIPCYSGQTPAMGCTFAVDNYPYQDADGKPTANAPEFAASMGARYEMTVGDGLRFMVAADARYSDEYNPSGFDNPLAMMDSYWTVDASVRFGRDDGLWEVALLGKNLTDQFYVSGVVDGPLTGTRGGTADSVFADQLGFGNVPRTVVLQLSTRF
ncbi:MAG TPA: TonB-dependent receptor [Steroidobacteraceae bacterium]|nr:TonB-dependent receptor [Steroidobacteraceae bacterium]